MKKNFIWFLLIMKKTIKNKALLLLLCLIPVCALFLAGAGNDSESETMSVGIYTYGNDQLSLNLVEGLDNYTGSVDFIKYTDEDKLKDDVSNEKLECGYVIPDNLTELTNKDKFSHCIKMIKSPSTMMFEAINEIIFSELIKLQGGIIIENYINSTDLPIAGDESALELLQEKYQYYLNSDETFHADFFYYEEGDLVEAESTGTASVFPLKGVIAVVIFLSGLFSSVSCMNEREKEIFLPMSRSFKKIALVLYPFCSLLLFSLSGLIAVLCSNEHESFLYELGAMIVYLIICLLFCTVLTIITRSSKVLTACIPVLVLMSLLICPVFINTGAILPFAKVVEKLLPPFYYLKM